MINQDLQKGLQLMSEGKEEGFNLVYSHTYDYVYRRAKVIMKNEQDAMDLTQETYIQAYKGIASLKDRNNIYAWLGSIVYKQGMMIFRKRKELLLDEEAENIFADIATEDKEDYPEESVEAKATSEIIQGMIDELPDLQRTTIMAFYFDDMKISQIAELFQCSENTVKSRLNYAKKFLKEKVLEHEKKNQYRLCSVSPVILLMAFRAIFASEEGALSEKQAQAIYHNICHEAGLKPSHLSIKTATRQAAKTSSQVVGNAKTITQSASLFGKIAGIPLGIKAGIGITAAVLIIGGVAIGGSFISDKNKPDSETKPIENTNSAEPVTSEPATSTESIEESTQESVSVTDTAATNEAVTVMTTPEAVLDTSLADSDASLEATPSPKAAASTKPIASPEPVISPEPVASSKPVVSSKPVASPAPTVGSVVETHTHSYVAYEHPATCENDGEKGYRCNCGDTHSVTAIAALGHNWGATAIGIFGDSFSCTDIKGGEQTCSTCGKVQTVPITWEHTWGDYTITAVESCTETGERQRTCTRCDEVEIETIPMTEHNYNAAMVDEETGAVTAYLCSKCGKYKE